MAFLEAVHRVRPEVAEATPSRVLQAMKARTRVLDLRGTMGVPSGHVEMPTFTIPEDCKCSWSVITPGPGLECVSRLRFRSAMCRHKHVPPQEVSP